VLLEDRWLIKAMIFFSTPQSVLPDYPLKTSEERDLNQNDPQQISDEDYENVEEMPAEGE